MRELSEITCNNCGESLSRKPSAVSKFNYCSQSCAASVNNRTPKVKLKPRLCKYCHQPTGSTWKNKKTVCTSCKGSYSKLRSELKEKVCVTCNVLKPIELFHKKNDRRFTTSVCKECFNSYCMQRWIATKIKAIEYKGGKCQDCHVPHPDLPFPAFEFHHRDPSTKEMGWTKLRLRPWSSIIKELDKCDLLCSNCHRVRHYNQHRNIVAPPGVQPG